LGAGGWWLVVGGSGNEAGGGEMEYDGRVAGVLGVSACGKGGRYGAQWGDGQIGDRRGWETGGLDVV
jgi:hypothetical protein